MGGRIGNAHLRWAFSEASLLYLRGNKQAEKYYNRLISRHGKGKALTIIAKRLGVVVCSSIDASRSAYPNASDHTTSPSLSTAT
jgi:transposase